MTFSFAGLLTRAAFSDVTPETVAVDQVDGFLLIGADGAVTCYSRKVDPERPLAAGGRERRITSSRGVWKQSKMYHR